MRSSLIVSKPSSLGLGDFPHLFMPPGATPVSRVGFQANIAAGNTFTLSVGQQILIPIQNVGWLKQIAITLGSYGAGQTWTLLQNGVAQIRDYINVPTSLGAPETPVERTIQLFPQQPLSIQFYNGSNVPMSVSWSLYGWYYPQPQ